MISRNLTRALAALAAATAAPWTLAAPVVDVTVVDGAVSVSQTTVRTVGSDASVTWSLKTPGYVFAGGGVSVADGAPYRCVAESSTRVRCDKTSRSSGSSYSYAVSVRPAGESRSGPTSTTSDVWIQND